MLTRFVYKLQNLRKILRNKYIVRKLVLQLSSTVISSIRSESCIYLNFQNCCNTKKHYKSSCQKQYCVLHFKTIPNPLTFNSHLLFINPNITTPHGYVQYQFNKCLKIMRVTALKCSSNISKL